MLDVSQGIWRMTVRVLRAEDARCESGIWRTTVRVLRAEDARCESGIWRMTVRVLWSEDAGCESGIWKMTVRELNGGSQVGDSEVGRRRMIIHLSAAGG